MTTMTSASVEIQKPTTDEETSAHDHQDGTQALSADMGGSMVNIHEPSAEEHGRNIATGAVTAACSYGFCRLFMSSEQTEDVVDMVHSLGSSSVAIYGICSMKPHPLHKRCLPPHLASGSGPIVRMFTYSMGYFSADFALIVIDVLFRRKFPRLWLGRLGHHIVQFVANSYCSFGRQQRADVMLANRSVLCTAYLAELSSVFLRLSNLVRTGPLSVRRTINWMLVAVFFGSRIVNFPYAIAMYWNCHTIAPPNMYRSYIAATSAGYALSVGWFLKIVKIALKAGIDSGSLPSVEC